MNHVNCVKASTQAPNIKYDKSMIPLLRKELQDLDSLHAEQLWPRHR